MMEVCKTCTFFDPFRAHPAIEKTDGPPKEGVCTWLPPPLIHMLITKAELEPTGRINWTQLFRHHPVTSVDDFCSCWSVNTALAEAKPDQV